MSDEKLIAVFGATGAQGGGLVKAILDDKSGGFAVRAITRDVNSDKAKALAAAGAEVVAADVDDPGSVERALKGCYGAFFVTFFWHHFSADKEIAEVEHFARAAKAAGLKHAIWSTLEDTRKFYPLSDTRMPTLQGKYKVPHFDGKGASDHFFTDLGVPTTFLIASFYWDNFIHFGAGPRPGEDGELVLALPLGGQKLPGIAAADIGAVALGILRRGASMVGQRVGIAGEILSGEEMAAKMSRALGRPVRFWNVPFETYRGFGFPGADDMGNMFEWQALLGPRFLAARDVAATRALHPGLLSFDAWLSLHAKEIPLG